MITRKLFSSLQHRLTYYPGVVLLGPRQVGKTTLARELAAAWPGAVMLDLERESDRARLARPDLFFARHRDRLVVLDEVQNAPELFAALRPEIDQDRRPGRFLLLGSASGKLLQQSSESLAGRVAYLELAPFLVSEVAADQDGLMRLLLRGGFPLSHAAPDDALSFLWREDFTRTFLERDLPQLGVTIPAETLRRFWRMLAHVHGQQFNASQLGQALGGLAHTTVGRYLDLLVQTMMVRRLEPLHVNLGKRLVKSPKVYVRDSGLLNYLLNLSSLEVLLGHPVVGAAWEGLVVEQVYANVPGAADLAYFRTAAGAELDLVLSLSGKRYAFEAKFSTSPKPSRGFWQAMKDLEVERAWVVAPVEAEYPLDERVDVVPCSSLEGILQGLGGR